MKISYNWLKEYLIFDLDIYKICEILTDIGLEVESCKKSKNTNPFLKNIILGKIQYCIKHPYSNHLKIVHVDIGEKKELQIISGANNININQKVLVALINNYILNEEGKKIYLKKKKIKGIISEGIICSANELALKGNSNEILTIETKDSPGILASKILKINEDYIIQINLTPNRSDAMGYLGIARDLYAALKTRGYKAKLYKPIIKNFNVKDTSNINVYIESSNKCIRYSGCLIENIKIKSSPIWLKNRLRSIELKPVNNIIDVINFVMYEFGQPIHVFDADRIEGKEIHIKTNSKNKFFESTNQLKYTLNNEDLMIFDSKKPICMAGIIGSLDSKITINTKNIFLESSYFDPVIIRNSSKRHKINTESSFRFERGTDPEQVLYALKRAAILIKEITKGKILKPIDFYLNPIKFIKVNLRYKKINQLIGEILPKKKIKKILSLLEINILSEENEILKVSIPSYRVDVIREIDLIEEILRIYGYNSIKISKNFCFSLNSKNRIKIEKLENETSIILNGKGFYEVINSSLIHYKYQKFIKNFHLNQSIKLINPISEEFSILRQSLLFGLIEKISYNISRKNNSLKFFEWGKIYNKIKKKYIENYQLALIITEKEEKKNWLTFSNKSFSFFTLKGIVESLLRKNRIQEFTQQLIKDSLLDQSLLFKYKQKPIAHLGCVKQSIIENFDIKQNIFYAEIYWESIIDIFNKKKIYIQEISKYPKAKRDLSILLDEKITFEELYKNIKKIEKKIIKNIILFDIYKGERIPKGKKSYGLNFELEDSKETLTDERIEKVMENIRNKISKTLDVEFR